MLAVSTGAERRTNFERRMHRRAHRPARVAWRERLRAVVRDVNRTARVWIRLRVA